jgi:hypothetical protein
VYWRLTVMQSVQVSGNTVPNMARRKIDTLFSIGAGGIVENTLNKLIHYQLAKYRDNIERLNRELEKFEILYKMTSSRFYEKFEAGELGDSGDFFEWSGLYENMLLFRERMGELEALNDR